MTQDGPAMRVALFSGNFNYLIDGAARALNRLAAHLVARSVDLTVFSPTRPEAAFPPVARVVSVPALPLPGRGEYLLGMGLTPKVKAELDAFKPTLIHISAPDLLGWSAVNYARKRNLASVASFHTRYDTYSQYYKLDILDKLAKKWLRHIHYSCDRVLAPTDETEAWLRENDMAKSIGRWARGVDRDEYNPAHRSLEWRRSLGIGDDDLAILFVARIVAEKGIKQFARVIDRIRAQGRNPKVLIVGDGPARSEFEADLGEGVFTGFLTGRDLSTAYASGDILFYPSITEAFPNVVLEAMASGLPTVCADTIGANSITIEGKTGFLVDPSSDEGYAEAIVRLLDDGPLRARMGERGRKESARYTWTAVLDEVIENYREVLALHDNGQASAQGT